MNASALRLYLVTDAPETYGGALLERVAAAIEGGASIVQYRDTSSSEETKLATARALRELTRSRGVPFIVNNDVGLALAVGADGAHVGQGDMPAAEARRRLGRERILGLSVRSLAELAAVDVAAVDYLGVGPVFPTGSKSDAAPAIGVAGLAAIVAGTAKPVVAIGGITVSNASEVFATGVAGIAVVAALSKAADPAAAARALLAAGPAPGPA